MGLAKFKLVLYVFTFYLLTGAEVSLGFGYFTIVYLIIMELFSLLLKAKMISIFPIFLFFAALLIFLPNNGITLALKMTFSYVGFNNPYIIIAVFLITPTIMIVLHEKRSA